MNLPNLIIGGVTKAGTTSLFTYLSDHPEISGAGIKETCYFLPIRFGKEIASVEEYSKFFDKYQRQPYLMEASPGYFFGGKALALRIKELLPGSKIIIMLRNPVKRCISFFKFHKNVLNLPKDMKIKDYLSTCNSFHDDDFKREENFIYYGLLSGVYMKFMDEWLEIFGNEIRIFFFEELKTDPEKLLFEICNWLKIDNNFYKGYEFVIENKTRNHSLRFLHGIALKYNKLFEKKLREHILIKRNLRKIYYAINGSKDNEEIDQDSIDYLNNYYYPYNQKLKNLLLNYQYKNLPDWLD